MTLCFTLTMPRSGSWNGKWTGDNYIYAKFLKLSNSKAGKEKAKKILDEGPYYYNFGDGWCASIDVKEVSGVELRRLKRLSRGFCGYDWMVDNIRHYGSIKTA